MKKGSRISMEITLGEYGPEDGGAMKSQPSKSCFKGRIQLYSKKPKEVHEKSENAGMILYAEETRELRMIDVNRRRSCGCEFCFYLNNRRKLKSLRNK